jgi:hypothetical protein
MTTFSHIRQLNIMSDDGLTAVEYTVFSRPIPIQPKLEIWTPVP